MGFFDRFVPLSAKGEKNFSRAMAAELRRDFGKAERYFTNCADALSALLEEKKGKKAEPLVRHLIMAGIACVRIGRNENAIQFLEQALERRDDIPDAWLHAGYAYAKEGQREQAVRCWKTYPDWSDDRIVGQAIKELLRELGHGEDADLDGACESVAKAYFSQMRYNSSLPQAKRDDLFIKRGY